VLAGARPLISGCENIGVVAFRKELRFRSEFAYQMSVKLAGSSLRSRWRSGCAATGSGRGHTRLEARGYRHSYFAHPFRPRFSIAGAAALFSFSKWLLLVNGLAFLKERLTDFVIGRSQGAAILGVYNVAWDLAYLPTSELGAPINRPYCPDSPKSRRIRRNCIRRTPMQWASRPFCIACGSRDFRGF